jgi:adenylosuccinate lyase
MSQGRIMAESVMIRLVEKGMDRQEAHELVRDCAMESYSNSKEFRTVLERNSKITGLLSSRELESALNPQAYIGTSIQQVERILKELK